jgi:transposase-like protein
MTVAELLDVLGWGRAAKEWREAMNQFAILYEERFTHPAHGGGR